MKKNEFLETIETMAQAWTDRHYEKVADFFADELFYIDPLRYALTTKRELLEFFENDDGCAQKCRFYRAIFEEENQTGAAEYVYEGTHRYHGTVWIRIENEKIVEWREYQHVSALDREAFWKRKI